MDLTIQGRPSPIQDPIPLLSTGPWLCTPLYRAWSHLPPPSSLDMFKLVHYEAQTAGKWEVGIRLNTFLLPSATQLRQGYVFTGICDSVHRGRVADTYWADTSPGRHTPLARHPPAQCMLGYTPLPSACWDTHLSAQCMLGYMPILVATAADGTHPAVMHSC